MTYDSALQILKKKRPFLCFKSTFFKHVIDYGCILWYVLFQLYSIKGDS